MEKRRTAPTSVRWSGQVRIKTLYKWRLDWRVIPSPPILSPHILFSSTTTIFVYFPLTKQADNDFCVFDIECGFSDVVVASSNLITSRRSRIQKLHITRKLLFKLLAFCNN